MKLEILNKDELDSWIHQKLSSGFMCAAIKGEAPKGATYSDGEIIINKVNIAWYCEDDGSKIMIEYKVNHAKENF